MRVLHVDTGTTMRGGQWQLRYLDEELRRAGHETRVLAGVPELGSPFSAARLALWSRWADITHCHDARSHTYAAALARRPFVVSRRVGWPVREGTLSNWKYRQAAGFLAVSEFVEARLRVAGFDRTHVVYDGVPLPASVSRRDGPVIAMKTDDTEKGADLLRQTGLKVVFSDNLDGDLPSARLFVYISRLEGLGSAALLAMAHGVPVVASRVGGLPEIVRHGVTGITVANEVAAIQDAVREVLADEALAAGLAARGRALVESGFTTAHMARATLEVYQKVLAR